MAISKILHISQPEVSRLLIAAQKAGWLGLPQFTAVDPETWQAAQERFFSTTDLRDALRERHAQGGRQLHRVTVLSTGPDGHIGPATVAIFRTLLGDAGSVGVTWGNTLSRITDALRQLGRETPWRERTVKVVFVPLCGEPLINGGDPSTHSSSVLAMRLSEIFNSSNDAGLVPSIAGVQAFIPLKFGKRAEVDTIRRFIGVVRGHARVFGSTEARADGPPPLAETLDAILTSVGRADSDRRGIFLTERVQVGDITDADMERCVAGDIGGVIIPNAGISKEDTRHIAQMNDNWTGVRLDHLRRCADAARTNGFVRKKPGVILLALGAHRLKVVLRCIELGLVNELVIDKDLEGALRGQVLSDPT